MPMPSGRESARDMWRRRVISIPLYWIAFVLVVGGLPLWLVLATLIDVGARGSLACRRTVTFLADWIAGARVNAECSP